MATYNYSTQHLHFMQDLPYPAIEAPEKEYTVLVPTLVEDTGFSDKPFVLLPKGTKIILGCGQNFGYVRVDGLGIFRY